jgi:hypothetical protein
MLDQPTRDKHTSLFPRVSNKVKMFYGLSVEHLTVLNAFDQFFGFSHKY